MNLEFDVYLLVLAALVLLFAAAWWLRGRSVHTLHSRCASLQSASEDSQARLARTLARCDELQGELSGLHAKLGEDETRIEQLRDLVKIHVARRREFDEWAAPIRASLGEAVSQTLRTLKEQITQQEFTLQRQNRRVNETEMQFQHSRDELERMRRELTLKNYHIAALNERFIRVEERMQELTTQVAAIGTAGGAPAAAAPAADVVAAGEVSVSPETERFSLDKPGSRDWMEVLDDWHRQLHDRLDRMDRLQAQLRAGTQPAPSPETLRRGGDGSK
jgi:TolA-binding protein